jgi:hypothetical protein
MVVDDAKIIVEGSDAGMVREGDMAPDSSCGKRFEL